ncbi:acyltransferase [soil metagenome]
MPPPDAAGSLAGGIEGAAPTRRGAVRFVFIDALRGLAAIFVLVFHLFITFKDSPLFAHAPRLFRALVWRGYIGVYMFFVISGFVIAYSIREQRIDGRFLARFALRRSIRLDPSYWAAIAAAALLVWKLHASTPSEYPQPSVKLILLHIAYLPEIFGYRYLLGVFWTLCVEVQLYITFVLLIGALQTVARWLPGAAHSDRSDLHGLGRIEWLLDVVLAVSGAVSACALASGFRTNGWLVEFWFAFALGALICRAISQEAARWALYLLLAVVLGCILICPDRDMRTPLAATLLTCLAIHVVAVAGGLTLWLRGPILQWLGRISYSLYLWHMVAIPLLMIPARSLIDRSIASSGLLFFACVGASLALAQLMYWIVERPSLRLAMRIKARTT